MVKDHSDSEKGNPLPPHRLLFLINSNGSYKHHPTDRIAHTMAFVTPVVEHWLEWEIAQWVHPMKDQSERRLLPWSYINIYSVQYENWIFIPYTCLSSTVYSYLTLLKYKMTGLQVNLFYLTLEHEYIISAVHSCRWQT